MSAPVKPRGDALRPPEPSLDLQRARTEHATYRGARERLERRSIVRGLIVLALLALAFSIWHASLDRVFVSGWWRQW